MSRNTPRDPRYVIRRLRAALDDRMDAYEVTPAFAERVRRLRDRRRTARRSAMAVTLTAAVVVLALVAGNVLWPQARIGLVSRPTASPSPTAMTESASPSAAPAEAPSRSERPPAEPSEQSESATPSETAPSETTETLTSDTPLDLYGIGPIEAGMTLAEAERTADVDFTVHNFVDHNRVCFHVTADGMEEDFVIRVVSPDGEPLEEPGDGVIATVSVDRLMESPAETLSGVGIGDTEQEVFDTYSAELVASEPHVYVEGGHYLFFVPRDPADRDYNVKFDTDGEVVTAISVGDADHTRAVEGCA
jgi:hypothetical protein